MGEMLYQVLIRCPIRGEPVYTGLDMDPDEFEATEFSMSLRKCSLCGDRHTWTKADAWLQQQSS
jgi:hypothetical protein